MNMTTNNIQIMEHINFNNIKQSIATSICNGLQSWYNGTWLTPKGKCFKQKWLNIYRSLFFWPIVVVATSFAFFFVIQILTNLSIFINYIHWGIGC